MLENQEIQLNEKQRRFCEEYVIDWNATRAAKVAGYSEKTAAEMGYENLRKPQIQAYITEIQKDLSKLAGVSALRNILELKKLAYSNLSKFKDDWMTEKEFNELTEDEKACLSEIIHTSKTTEFGTENIVKFKLFDKIKAIETINKMLGYNSPDKIDHSTLGDKVNTNPTIIAAPEVAETIKNLMDKFK